MPRFIVILCLPLLLLPLWGAGCTAFLDQPGPTLVATSEAFKFFSGEYENTAYFARHKPRRIAVMPFSGEKASWPQEVRDMRPVDIVRRGFYNHVSSLPFQDLQLYDTDLRLKNADLTDAAAMMALLKTDSRKLQRILEVDAVVTGELTHFDRTHVGIYSQVAVGCEVQMWDLASGELLWRAKHVSRAHAGGISLSPIGLAMAAISATWNLREVELFRQTDDLFREMVSTIELPASMRHAMLEQPNLDLFVCLNPEQIFTAGDRVALRLIGDANARASADLGDFRHGIQLTPVHPSRKEAIWEEALEHIRLNYTQAGHEVTPALLAALRAELAGREVYEGVYTVMPDEEAYHLLAKGYLVNAAGGRATEVFVTHHINIDAKPPAVPQGLEAVGMDGRIRLEWMPNTESDLAGYEVWQSNSPLSGYQRVKTTETSFADLGGLTNFQTVYLQIRALDHAGNASPFAPAVESTPVPDPQLTQLARQHVSLGGTIDTPVLLARSYSPYTANTTVRIASGGALYVEPGVVIHFAPGTALHNDGGQLVIFGTRQQPVSLKPTAGVFEGVLITGGQSKLAHVTIGGAQTGLRVRQAAPDIQGLLIDGATLAGIHLETGARPIITCSQIRNSLGMGGLLVEGTGIAPRIRQTVFDNNQPFQVQSYTPVQLDLSHNYWGHPNPPEGWFLGHDLKWQPVLTEVPQGCDE